METLIGRTLGQYRITDLLGKGGMATVYRAFQERMQRDVALKVIKPDLAETQDFLQRFEREALMSASFSHPHILKVFDYGQEGELVYLVMELLDGGSLADAIRQARIPTEQLLKYLDQVASALDYAHQRGIIHRDLKPQNIMLDGNGNAFLTDFGIAKLLGNGPAFTQTGVAVGTPAYMSPEQWRGDVLDARSDIYAFGVVIFEVLTGELPFNGDTPFNLMYGHLNQAPPSIGLKHSALPPALDPVLQRALAKTAEERYQTAGDLAADLRLAISPNAGETAQRSASLRPSTDLQSMPTHEMTVQLPTKASGANGDSGQPTIGKRTAALSPTVILGAVGLIGLAIVAIILATQANRSTVSTVTETAVALRTQTTVALAAQPTANSTETPVLPASATVTASSTVTTTPTITPTSTPTETATLTLTYTPSHTATPDITGTQAAIRSTFVAGTIIAATEAANVLAAQTAFAAEQTQTATLFTLTPSATPTFTATLTATFTPSLTKTATVTPSLTSTRTATFTPSVTNTTIPTATLTPLPASALIGGGTGLIVYNIFGAIWLMNADGSDPRQIARGIEPSWSPDGSKIVYVAPGGSGGIGLYICNADGSNPKRLVDQDGNARNPKWSPDGTRILFHADFAGENDLYVVNVDGTNLERLTDNEEIDREGAWSPDGSKIAFWSIRDQIGIYVMNADGSDVKFLIRGGYPSWSPDGTQIAFVASSSNSKSGQSVYAVGVNGRGLREVGKEATFLASPPAWSPDGMYLLYIAENRNREDIYLIEATGANLRQLTATRDDDESSPNWQPLPAR